MSFQKLTVNDLRRILRDAVGGEAASGDILDTAFSDLDYDSLALLETGSRIEREYGITLADSAIFAAETPRALLDLVNEQLAARFAP